MYNGHRYQFAHRSKINDQELVFFYKYVIARNGVPFSTKQSVLNLYEHKVYCHFRPGKVSMTCTKQLFPVM